jgi:hypothetical protein
MMTDTREAMFLINGNTSIELDPIDLQHIHGDEALNDDALAAAFRTVYAVESNDPSLMVKLAWSDSGAPVLVTCSGCGRLEYMHDVEFRDGNVIMCGDCLI